MPECIICRKNKDEMSDEHVIPDALGGYYHIKKVCENCNSKLGEKVDSKLTNHVFSKFMRYKNDLKGKKSSIPNPFSGTHILKSSPDTKVKILLDEQNRPFTYLLPKIDYEKSDSGTIKSLSIKLDKSDEKDAEKIFDRILRRKKIPAEALGKQEVIRTIHQQPEVRGKFLVDIKDFKIGMLKIAYEFAVDTIPDYYHSNEAKIISKSLIDANTGSLPADIFSGTGFEKDIKKSFDHIIDTESKKHYLLLATVKSVGLICMVFLYDTFSIGIKLSSDDSLLKENWIIGINDIGGKYFRKLNAQEAIEEAYSRPKIRFEYNLPSLKEVHEFQAEERNPDFDFFQIGNQIPLFDTTGKIAHNNVSELISNLAMANKGTHKGNPKKELTYQVEFEQELYVKILPSQKFYRVTAARSERFLIKKL